MKRFSGAMLLVATIAAGCSSADRDAAAQNRGKPAFGTWGFDLGGMNNGVKPGDDFFRYAGGTWMKNAEIPPDRSRWGSFTMLAAKADEDVKVLIEDVAGRQQPPGSPEQKVADYYNAYLDTGKIEQLGLKPFRPDLDRIAALKTHEELAAFIGDPNVASSFSPIAFFFNVDDKNPDGYSVDVAQSGLGMPEREYYLDAEFTSTRDAYRAYITKMLGLADYPDAAASADQIMALETRIAEVHWSMDERRDVALSYNPRTLAELKRSAPEFPWDDMLRAGGLEDQDFFILRMPQPVAQTAKLFRATPVADWRAYLTFHYLNAHADIMPTALDDAGFDFNGKVLLGKTQKPERWKRAVLAIGGQYGDAPMAEAVGRIYVKKHFTPEAKAQVLDLVSNLLASYRARIATLEWMTPETRRAAMRKAETVRVKIGYPDRWRDYSTLETKPGDAYGNRERAETWDWERRVARLPNKADKDEWLMAPQTVNAYYGQAWNEIVFPAAILQPPFFDPHADAAVNHGAIGGVIGHEMGHGYDDQGAKSDENGILRNWWKKDDEDRFKAKVAALSKQYFAYEPLPGLRVNGDSTAGENVGDLGGLTVALQAYELSLGGKPAPVVDGFTGQQRVFLGWAQAFRAIIREEALRNQVASDFHSPAEFRVNGVVRNIDAWYDAFDVQADDDLYLKPEERVRIW